MKRDLVERARGFRTVPTRSEAMVWEVLRDRQLQGVKFRRQFVIGSFIVDFCAPRQHLIIEIDGGVHETQHERDTERQRQIEIAGYRMLRLSAEADISAVPSTISTYIFSPSPSPNKP